MTLETRPWDSAEFLETEEDMQEFLTVAFEGNDPVHIAKALGTVAKARSMSKLARDVGMTRAALYRAFSGETRPEFATIMKILDALGIGIVPVIRHGDTDKAA